MTDTASPSRTAQTNIEKVVHLEEVEERHRAFADRFPEMIGSFAGSVAFVVCQLAFVGLWACGEQRDHSRFDRLRSLPVFAAVRRSRA